MDFIQQSLSNTSATATTTSEYNLSNTIGISVALGINLLVCCVAIFIFIINRGFVLPILLCQSICFAIQKRMKHSLTENQFSIFNVSSKTIPKLLVMTFLMLFVMLRCVTLCFRIAQFAVYGQQWSIVDAMGNVLFVVGLSLMLTLFSTFLLLWLQFIYSINKAHQLIHPAGFVLFLIALCIANLIGWIAILAIAAAYCVPKYVLADPSQFFLLAAGIPAVVYVLTVILVDLVLLFSGISILVMLVKSYRFQKRQFEHMEHSNEMMQNTLGTKMKQLMGLMVRFGVVIVAFLFAVNILVIGLIIMATGTRPWIIVMFMQTIPESIAVVAMCIFFCSFF